MKLHPPLVTKPLPLASEQVEPTMALIKIHLLSRVEAARAGGDDAVILSECNHLWEAMRAIQMVAICLRSSSDNCDCLHFSISASNELRETANYIEAVTGIDPYKAWCK